MVKNKSAEEGSRVHDVIQRHLAGELMDVPRELTHVVSAFEKFNKQQGIFFHPEAGRQNRLRAFVQPDCGLSRECGFR